jgi:3-oxoacyl-[acyl-carrier-protein] synthase-3
VNRSDHLWEEACRLTVLSSAQAYPGESVGTTELLEQIDQRFGLNVSRRGLALARKLKIGRRHVAREFAARTEGTRPGHGNVDLAARALRQALRAASLGVNDLGYLIGHTATPALPLPANIALVAKELGFRGPFAEFRQACTGFVNALIFARGLLAGPRAKPVAIVGSETGSVFFDPMRAGQDPGQLVNLIQMGDGAGAVILGAESSADAPVITYLYHGQDALDRKADLSMPCGGSLAPTSKGNGTLEFEHHFAGIREHGLNLLLRGWRAIAFGGNGLNNPNWVLPHQANGRMDEYLRPHLPADVRVMVHADRVGNTGSAAIWLAFDELRNSLAPGQTVAVLGAEATQYMYGGFLYRHGTVDSCAGSCGAP